MSVRNLDYLLRPRSVGVIPPAGLTDPSTPRILASLRVAFAGPVVAIDADDLRRGAGGLRHAPDLALIALPQNALPELVAALAKHGTRAAVLLGGAGSRAAVEPAALRQALVAGRPFDFRLLGPGSLGVAVPALGLQAALLPSPPAPGALALVAQSAPVGAALADAAAARGIGFSCFVSLGESSDVDVADVLDEVGSDPDVRAILLQIDAVESARKFVSAARAAARNKPVIALAAGLAGAARDDEAGGDAFDAVARRAGMLRVRSTLELFGAAEVLARGRRWRGPRLALIGNGAALCNLARGAAARESVSIVYHGGDARGVGLADDASPDDYRVAIDAALASDACDAALVLHAAMPGVPPEAIAGACVSAASAHAKLVMAAFVGGRYVEAARTLLADAGMPSYRTPDLALRAFAQLARYHRHQRALLETPPATSAAYAPVVAPVRRLVAEAVAAERRVLSHEEVALLLDAYGVHVADGRDPQHGGTAALLRVYLTQDAVFGPVIRLGTVAFDAAAGVDAIALPPLNLALAADVVTHARLPRDLLTDATRASRLAATLVAVARIACDLPQVARLVLEPLRVDAQGCVALRARVELRDVPVRGSDHLAIRPYPDELAQWFASPAGRVLLRPIRPEDGDAHRRFLRQVQPADLRLRFGRALREVAPSELARMTQIDYDREMAFLALVGATGNASGDAADGEIVGEIRTIAESAGVRAQFAIVVRSDFQRRGLGALLLRKLIAYARDAGVQRLYGLVAADNQAMLGLARRLGFDVDVVDGSATAVVTLDLQHRVEPRCFVS